LCVRLLLWILLLLLLLWVGLLLLLWVGLLLLWIGLRRCLLWVGLLLRLWVVCTQHRRRCCSRHQAAECIVEGIMQRGIADSRTNGGSKGKWGSDGSGR
jgi:hypothetical protein